MAWFGFFIFCSVFVICDSWIFSQGYNSLLQGHKTPEEKEIQKLKIQQLRNQAER